MKISIIGAGNVGSLTAMRIAQEGIGDIVLVDIINGLAEAKALDLEDAQGVLKYRYNVQGAGDMKKIAHSDIIVVTAGLTRKPGMQREELMHKNALILKDICVDIKKLSPGSVVIVVTNPLDLMTYFTLKATGFERGRVFGMGITLDCSRFVNIISKELNIPIDDIDATVIGSHGEGMLPLARLTNIKGIPLDEFLDDKKVEILAERTVSRGQEIVSLLGSGSAYFAPSAAIAALVRAVAKDEKRILGVSACLNGEFGVKGVCIGVPCRLGKEGIEKIIELQLNGQEKEAFLQSSARLKEQYSAIAV